MIAGTRAARTGVVECPRSWSCHCGTTLTSDHRPLVRRAADHTANCTEAR